MAFEKVHKPVTKGVAKVPVVMQMEALECGAAALTMIMAYYGLWVPLEQVRKDCGVSRDGSSAKNVLKAARNYGFTAQGYRFEPKELEKDGVFPCIIHWEFNHFVVLDGFKGNKAYLNDPAKGAYAVSMEVFDEAFTGVCLMIEPGENFKPGGKPKSILEFARKRMKGAEAAVFFVVLTTILGSLFGIFNATFTELFMNQLLTGYDRDWLYPFIAALAFLSFLQVVVAWIKAIYSLRINGKMAVVGNTTFMWKVLRLPMEFFSQRMAGDILMRQGTNARIAGTLVNTFAPMILNAGMAVFYLVVMMRSSLLLTSVGLLSICLNLLVSRIITDKRINITRVMMRDQGKLSGTTVSGIEMIETIKSSGAEDGFFEKWAGYQAGVNTQGVRYKRLDAYLGLIPQLISGFADTAVLVLGAFLVMRGQFLVGMIMEFQIYMNSFLAPTETLISTSGDILEMRTDMERVQDVMEYPDGISGEEEAEDSRKEYSKLTGHIVLKNVTFGYSKLADPLIRDFNLEIKPGSRVAFVGFSGCGKSTMAKLISGLYEPWEGDILFDGKHISEIDRSIFTGSVAVVDQDIILFEDTIANNIRMWDTSIKDFEVIMAARDAHIHSDILLRDKGYNYVIMEGGKDFSGGQRQRLEIARVLAQDPTVIILDEATSALDARTEFEVVNSIRDRGIACIVIAHRLSTIRDCDEILVLDKGIVVERGTHDELMEKNGLYTKLVTSE
ncbi:MAG: NHLP family bacteriocin export ABC transporter peptidase/permease/ATPase subunit [Lachnospiraceae bacterium]|nr:NHLP family bacteriocin export ABC transporter peptidase/permease/ATPase subunit [Lachnospiraceae bacterium]